MIRIRKETIAFATMLFVLPLFFSCGTIINKVVEGVEEASSSSNNPDSSGNNGNNGNNGTNGTNGSDGTNGTDGTTTPSLVFPGTTWKYTESDGSTSETYKFNSDGTYDWVQGDLTVRGKYTESSGKIITLTSITYAQNGTTDAWTGNCEIEQHIYLSGKKLYAFALKNPSATDFTGTWSNKRFFIYTDTDTGKVIGIATQTFAYEILADGKFTKTEAIKLHYNNIQDGKDSTASYSGTWLSSGNKIVLKFTDSDYSEKFLMGKGYLVWIDSDYSFSQTGGTTISAPDLTDTGDSSGGNGGDSNLPEEKPTTDVNDGRTVTIYKVKGEKELTQYIVKLYVKSDTKSVIISDGYTSIGKEAFWCCASLTSVTIPNSVTSIGHSAFYGCTSLASVTIPNSVASIEGGEFAYCKSLESIVVNENNSHYLSENGVLFNKNKTALIAYPAGKKDSTYTIPNNVTSIGYDAFAGCTLLTSVTIPNSVTSIGQNAFSGCTSLTSVTIPNSVTSIGQNAFFGCTLLASMTIQNSVTSIGQNAFSGCTSLTSVTIPNSVTSIGSRAFYGCSSLTSVKFENTKGWKGYNEEMAHFPEDKGTAIDVTNPATNASALTSGVWKASRLWRE